ncbi:MAG: hypothetical protein B9S32_06585 [Verrucomicrobia bacterium Tous-C9LFEB]|nr:MAG: hypothetical protein B9S32_06585 [Verrucomicrobia bacterium Tous-C9LFEB]
MDNSSKKETMMFVALPGTDPYAEVPKKQVKDQLDKGLLKQSALIWSQKHNSWKQARHITQLIASKLQPRPAQAPLAGTAQPRVNVQPVAAAQPKAQTVKPAAPIKVASVPKNAGAKPAASHAAPAAAAKPATPAASHDLHLEGEGAHRTPMWLKAVCAALVVIILGLMALNWYYVDHAIKANLAEDNTPFKEVPLYAHLGGFFQASNLIIHLRPTDTVTRENFLQYLSAIANATPDRPMSTRAFDVVSLSSGWSADYHMSGRNWRRLAKPDLSDDDRRAILLESVYIAGGEKLIPRSNLDASGQLALETKRWNDFVSTFVKK